MPDKRDYLRYVITDYVNLKDEKGAEIVTDAVLSDISFRGMSLELKKKLDVGTIVQFEIITNLLGGALTGKAVVKNVSEVKHRDEVVYRTGMGFTEVSEDIVSALLNRIQRAMCERTKRKTEEGNPDYGAF